MMEKIVLPALMCVFLCIGCHCNTQPGFKLRLTSKGLDYVNTVAEAALADQLNKMHIPNQSGSGSRLSWWLTSIQNRGATIPSSRMAYHQGYNGVSWYLNNFGLSLYSDWGARYRKGWFKVSTSGRVSLNIRRVSLSVTARLGTQAGGKPSVSMSRCSASIGEVDVRFHGGISFILNLFRKSLGRKIRRLMEGQVCNVVRNVINVDANREMAKLKFNVGIGKHFVLDYNMVDTPTIDGNNAEFKHKGKVYWRGDNDQSVPFSPRPIPPLSDTSRMLYLWVTDYAANSFSHTSFKHKILVFTIDKDHFPPEHHSYLSTSCEMFCIGNFIPEIEMMFPNSFIEIVVKFTTAPVLRILPDVMTVTAEASITFLVRTPEGETNELITLNSKASVSVFGSVINEKVTGAIVDCKLEVDSVESNVGHIDPDDLNAILQAALDIAVIPNVNNILKKGIGLPITGLVYFHNTELLLLNGSLVIATDVTTQLHFQGPQMPIPKLTGSISEKTYMSRLNRLSHQSRTTRMQYTTTTTEKPMPSTTKPPVTSTTKPTELSTTKAPEISTTKPPIMSTTQSPAKSTTKQPAISTTKSPELSTTKHPAMSTTKSPELSTTKQPAMSTTKSPELSTTKQPAISTTKSPESSTTKHPAMSTTKSPESSTTKHPAMSTTKSPESSTTKHPAMSTTKSPELSTTKQPAISTTKSPELSTTEQPALSTTKSPTIISSTLNTPTKQSTSTQTTYPPDHISHFTKHPNCLTQEEIIYLSSLSMCDVQD